MYPEPGFSFAILARFSGVPSFLPTFLGPLQAFLEALPFIFPCAHTAPGFDGGVTPADP
jgi:hypothetical protein